MTPTDSDTATVWHRAQWYLPGPGSDQAAASEWAKGLESRPRAPGRPRRPRRQLKPASESVLQIRQAAAAAACLIRGISWQPPMRPEHWHARDSHGGYYPPAARRPPGPRAQRHWHCGGSRASAVSVPPPCRCRGVTAAARSAITSSLYCLSLSALGCHC